MFSKAKCYKCIWCKNVFDAKMYFCVHFPKENVQYQMHFCKTNVNTGGHLKWPPLRLLILASILGLRTIEKFYRESSVLTPAIYHLWNAFSIICGFPCLYIFQRKMFRWRPWSHVQGHELNLSLYYCLLYSQPFNRFLSLCSNACSLGPFQMSAGINEYICLQKKVRIKITFL